MSTYGRFLRSFEGATFVVVALGFASLFISGQLSVLGLMLVGAAMAGAWGESRWPPISEGVWRALALMMVLGLGAGYGLGLVPSLRGAGILLIFLQIQRLYMRRDNRDYTYLFLLSFLQLLLGCVLTIAPSFAFVLIFYLIAVTWALLLFQLKQGMDGAVLDDPEDPSVEGLRGRIRVFLLGESRPREDVTRRSARYSVADRVLTAPFVAATTGVTLLMLVLTLGVFLAAPRLDLSLFRGEMGRRTHVAGFSDTVTLGEVGEIQEGQGRVMRVRLRGPMAESGLPLYFRGAALDTFDGLEWRLSRQDKARVTDGQGFLNPPDAPRADIIQDITLEPLDTEVIFALSQVISLEADTTQVFRAVTGSISLASPPGRFQYTAYSRIPKVSAEDLRGVGESFPPQMRKVYLQMPKGVATRIRPLAKEVTEGANTQFDKMQAIENWLSGTFEYTLSPEAQGPSPVEDFLFRTKAGHCEYFASSMVLMARSLGYPARMVTGFAGGAWNDFGGYYTITQGNAHAWVEIYFNRYGWRRFDPTPAGVTDGMAKPQGAIAASVDYLESLWYFYVLDFGLQDQLTFARDLLRKARLGSVFGAGRDTGGVGESGGSVPGRSALPILGGIALFGALGLIAFRLAGGRGKTAELEGLRGEPKVVKSYLKARVELERLLGKRGFARGESETPMERARRAAPSLGEDGPVLESIEGEYYGLRYGDVALTRAALERLRALVEGIRKAESKPPA